MSKHYVDDLGKWLGRATGLSALAAALGYVFVGGIAMNGNGLFFLLGMIGAFVMLWIFVIFLILFGEDK